ncbi:MAG: 50S ribosomal protein L4 [Chitinophagales bacterium]
MKIEILNKAGEKTGKHIDLNDDIFGIEPNEHVMYLAVKQYLANQRQGTHKAKERGETAGSTRKLHRQKGTGGSRKGSIKNPLYHGGGTIFGPRPRNYSFKLNRKVKELARRSALSQKAADKRIIVVEDFTMEAPKTKTYSDMLNKMGVAGGRTLFVVGQNEINIGLSGRNIRNADTIRVDELNTYGVLKAQHLILSESAAQMINQSAENN